MASTLIGPHDAASADLDRFPALLPTARAERTRHRKARPSTVAWFGVKTAMTPDHAMSTASDHAYGDAERGRSPGCESCTAGTAVVSAE